ncbi:MAG: adenosylcobinamide-GDP ribazoletransferase [Paracoccaceae bacterium]
MRENDTDGRFRLIDLALAVSLLSRLPVEAFVNIPQTAWDRQAKAVWAFSLVGVLVGAIAGLVGWISLKIGLPHMIAAGLALAVLIIITGAMHEDGLADCADGFWGAKTPVRRLEIMKDSSIGAYGALALILITGLRWLGYGALIHEGIGPFIAVAALSRGVVPSVMAAVPPARRDGLSRSVGWPNWETAAIGVLVALLVAIFTLGWGAFPATFAAAVAAVCAGALAHLKVGGQTGDVLGAVQQLSELAIILVLISWIPTR